MYLIQFDADFVVTSCVLAAMGPFLLPLSGSHVLAMAPVLVGQVFNPEMRIFGPPPRKRWITKLAFDNRFTMTEATNLKLAQMFPSRITDETDVAYAGRCALPAQLQVMASRLGMASYVDLDREDTRGGVQMLEQAGLLVVGRALEILDGPIADAEYYRDA